MSAPRKIPRALRIRLRQLAHAITPPFATSLDTYLELVKRGYAQPSAI